MRCSSSALLQLLLLPPPLLLLLLLDRGCADTIEISCVDFHPLMRLPCKCGLNAVNATKISCDGAVFAEFPLLPHRFYIQDFSHRNAGLQTLGAQVFTASDLPLVSVDFSDNQVHARTQHRTRPRLRRSWQQGSKLPYCG